MQAHTLTIDTISVSAKDVFTVRISANASIPAYQRAEIVGNTIVVRIPNAIMDANAIHPSCGEHDVRVKHERIRTTLVIRFVISVPFDSASVRRDGAHALAVYVFRTPTPQPTKSADTKWMLDVIVIDAGHGGVDGGAVGVNGISEKTVTLAIAKKVKSLIAQTMPETRVVLTRETDTFVELFKRTQIANEAKGKLFVSIHCNSMPTKPHPAHGCETYILRPGRNADAARGLSPMASEIPPEVRSLARLRYAFRKFFSAGDEAAREIGLTPQQHQLLLGTAGFTGRGLSLIHI